MASRRCEGQKLSNRACFSQGTAQYKIVFSDCASKRTYISMVLNILVHGVSAGRRPPQLKLTRSKLFFCRAMLPLNSPNFTKRHRLRATFIPPS